MAEITTTTLPFQPARQDPLMTAAQRLETTFLTQMLEAAGAGKPRDAFGGGEGEDQFSSFLLEAQAEEMVKAGGIGLAETIFHAMKLQENARADRP